MKYPIALSIAGSDSGGGAGIQADIKTMSAIGVFSTTAITAITAQNTQGVFGIQAATPELVGKQIEAVFSDMHPIAVKIGMLFSSDIIIEVANKLKSYKPRYIILDPVMISTSGSRLISENAIATMIKELFPIATIITPNRHEAEMIAGMRIKSDKSNLNEIAHAILNHGCRYVLIKGGHFDENSMSDFLYNKDGLTKSYKADKVSTRNTHGTGCTLSSAITAYLALGNNIEESVGLAKKYLQNALISGIDLNIGEGHGPVDHFFNLKTDRV